MFDRSYKSSAKMPEPDASKQMRAIAPVSRDSAAGVVSTKAQATPLIKDHSMLESVDGEGLVLIGRNTRLVGDITNCTKVEVQGALEGTLTAESIVVRDGGAVTGTVSTTNAVALGTIEGEVVVDSLLDVKSTGQVTGDISCGQLSVEIGGYISGRLNGEAQHQKSRYGHDLSVSAGQSQSSAANGTGYEIPHFDEQSDSA
jgi:cytoskeletal protein CcmA (bactofilin family)